MQPQYTKMSKSDQVTDQDIYTLDSVGVVIARQVIPTQDIARINQLLDSYILEKRPGKFPIMDIDNTFFDLMTIPWVMNLCKKMLGPGFRFDHSFGLQQPGQGEGPNLHGGPLSSQGCNYYVSHSDMTRCGRLSVGISLTHQSEKTGGFAYIPGSHKSSFGISGIDVFKTLLNHSFEHDCVCIPTLEPGDVCVFTDGLVHGTSYWKLGTIRRSLYYMYSPGFIAWRPYHEIEKYLKLAKNQLQIDLLRPPFVAEFQEDLLQIASSKWRKDNYGL